MHCYRIETWFAGQRQPWAVSADPNESTCDHPRWGD